MDSLNLRLGSQARIKAANPICNQIGLNNLFNRGEDIIARIAGKYIGKEIE
jgi:hypothetical protein